jgi:hypothetical protein
MNRALTLVALALFTHSYPAFALDLMTRPVGPVQTWQASDLARFTDQFVHVKFVEGSDVVWRGDHFADDRGHDLSVVRGALRKSDILEVRPTFDVTRQSARAWKAQGEAQSGVVGPDLSLWYTIRVRGGAEAVAKLINDLNASPAVEIAHPEPIVETADVVTPGHKADPAPASAVPPDFTGQQSYLYAPPAGLNAPAAWAYAGGKGQGGKFIDVELAWIENHIDFPFARLFYMGGAGQDPNQGYIDHGTAVLGEVIGQQTGFGIDGFAPELDGYGVVAITVAEWPNVPHYFQEAVDHLTAGDVWLIELQMYPPLTGQATPMEWLQVNYDVIWTSSWARNIICVEAGANGSQDLDAPIWGGVFDRNVRDSGAIMVGAGTPFGLVAEGFSNYGTRMDVHAWGSSIVTTGYGDLYTEGPQTTWYTSHFGGTSGASPMVTGAALCLGGIARAAQIPFTPLLIRSILHDTGTPQNGTRLIGPRPNLGAAAVALLQTAGVEHQATAAADWRIETTPNPFAEWVQLRLDGVGRDALQVGIYDATGRRLRGLLESPLGTGSRVVSWDGRDDRGQAVGSGVYFVKISAPGFERTVKVQKIH